MSTWRILVTVLLLIHPTLSQLITSTCEIPSVEAGENATLTIRFGQDLRLERIRDFMVDHIGHSSTASQSRLLDCEFSYGNVTCKKTTCCTWESHVTDVFRVYIHNVSQELEGRFWGFVIPADTAYQKYCDFSLKAFSCPTDSINATNSHMTCSNQSVTLCQTCTVTCNPGFHFKENHNSVTYTCVGKKKWFPENPLRSCEAYTCPTDSINVSNSQMKCTTQPVTIGETCIVTCNPGHYFKENQTSSVTYTCVEKNKWSTETPVTSCQEQAEGQKSYNLYNLFLLLLLLLLIPIARVIFFFCQTRRKERRKYEEEMLPLSPGLTPLPEDYWRTCIKKWYPKLQTRTYFLPPLHFNRVQYYQQRVAGYLVQVPQTLQHCDGSDDRALERVLLRLRALADNPQQADNSQQTDNSKEADNPQETDKLQQSDSPQQEEVMLVISQLQLGKFIGQPSYAAAVALSPLSSKRSGLSQRHYDKGDCDVLVIHKTLGLLTLQITSVGENFIQLEMTEEEQDDVVMKKVKEAVAQLNEAEVDLKHLTSDMADIKHITKILVLPNISSIQLLRAINSFPSDGQLLCACLGDASVNDAVKLCLLSDQLSDNQTSSDINPSSIRALREWWQRVVRVSRSESPLTSSLYEQLVARFCGPPTTVEVHCVTTPRLNIRTLGEAVSETGQRVARLVLFPQQVDILNQSPPQAFLSGPPGTGKTIVLIMQGLTWIQRGYDVHVVSTCDDSRAVTFVIKLQLQETAKISTTARSRVHRHHFDLRKDGQVKIAIRRLKSQSEGRQLCVIADEVVRDDRKSFTEFCDQLIIKVSGVFIWGASVYHDAIPECLKEFKLTTPLRSPPVVVREVMEAWEIKNEQVDDYTVSDVPVPTDGPPVMRIKHCRQSGHTESWPRDCVECGREVARVLTELDVGRTGNSNDPPPLHYRDVLVVCDNFLTDVWVSISNQVTKVTTKDSGLVRGLRDCDVPVRVVGEGDEAAIRDTALGEGDLVTVACWHDVQGLERKVVVVERGHDGFNRLHAMSRCTSQLVLIDWRPVSYNDDCVNTVENNDNG